MTKNEAMNLALEALEDMNCGWKYIRESHGDLYGVGWDRSQEKADDAIKALRQALDQLPDTTKMIDTGIDRGAWSDVPDATKWVDELRGDEEPPNSTTDIVESKKPVAYLYHDTVSAEFANPLADSTLLVLACDRKPNGRNETPLYTAPPKQEFVCSTGLCHYKHWVGLTDEEIRDIHWSKPMDEYSYARAIEAKLKEKNRVDL